MGRGQLTQQTRNGSSETECSLSIVHALADKVSNRFSYSAIRCYHWNESENSSVLSRDPNKRVGKRLRTSTYLAMRSSPLAFTLEVNAVTALPTMRHHVLSLHRGLATDQSFCSHTGSRLLISHSLATGAASRPLSLVSGPLGGSRADSIRQRHPGRGVVGAGCGARVRFP